jgi:hypothetical protein
LDAVFGIVTLIFMVLAVIQVAFALYGRNVVAASAHEGARAAVELGRDVSDAQVIARRTVERATGRLVTSLDVNTTVVDSGDRSMVRVVVDGTLRPFGPVPFPIHVSSAATAALPQEDL